MAGLALLVGVLSGLGALFLGWLISIVDFISFYHLKDFLSFLGPFTISLIGSIGGLLVGLLTYFTARETRGRGVPQVIDAIERQGGKIRARVAFIKALASALTIGTGGSAGREGPIVQIGASLGSAVGQLFKLSEQQLVALVACGTGAGIAAIFNAPLAGTIFALEVVLREFSINMFCLVVISSVSGTLISHFFLGSVLDVTTFSVLSYDIVFPVDMLFYVLLGIIAAYVSILFLRVFNMVEDMFKKIPKVPEWLLPALGGAAFGLFGYFLPETLGRGEQIMDQILCGELNGAGFLALLCLTKIITTSLTLGSGCSGGILFPSMFIGVCLGGSFGSVLHSLMPGLTGASGAYALVGMCAVFAATNRAPVTAILMVLEMTHDIQLIMPLMLACVVSTFLIKRTE